MVYMEAYDKLLESWLALVQDDKHFHQGFFTQHAVQVFNSYIQCHLAAPDGTRNLVSARPAAPVAPAPRSHPLRIVSCWKHRASFLEGSGERPTGRVEWPRLHAACVWAAAGSPRFSSVFSGPRVSSQVSSV